MAKNRAPRWRIDFLPYIGTADPETGKVFGSEWGREQEYYDKEAPARARYKQLVASGAVEHVELFKVIPDKRGGWGSRLLAEWDAGKGHTNPRKSDAWWPAGNRWLQAQAEKEAAAQRRAHIKRGRKKSTFRYLPPGWHREAMEALGEGDEERFKAIKMGQLGHPPLTKKKTTRRKAAKKNPSKVSVRSLVAKALK